MAWPAEMSTTELLDRQDVPKHDLRIEVLGTLDEASSALGIARAMTASRHSEALILKIQEDLCWMMSELAATTAEARPGVHITAERVKWLTDAEAGLATTAGMEPAATMPGDSASAGFVQLGHSIVRRAERLIRLLDDQGDLHNAQIIDYLSHLSALLQVLALHEDLMAR